MYSHLLRIILYILFTYLIGYNLLLLRYKKTLRKNNLFFKLGLSWAMGNLILMVILYGLALTNNLNLVNYRNFSLGLWLLILITSGRFFKNWRKKSVKIQKQDWLILFVLLLFFSPLIKHSLYTPLNAWDAMAIWMLKAKSFFYANGAWDNLLYKNSLFEYSHREYPIGLPLLAAGYYRIINFVNDQTVQLYLLFFYLNIVFLFFGFMKQWLPKISTLIRTLVTLSLFILPNFMLYAHNGYADMLMSFYISISIILFIGLMEGKKIKDKMMTMELLLMTSAAGMLIKNEGYSFLVIVLILTGLVLGKELKKISRSNIVVSLVILLVGLAIQAEWKHFTNVRGLGFTFAEAKILANGLPRMQAIFNRYLLEFLNTDHYSLVLIVAWLIAMWQYSYLVIRKKFRILWPSLIIGLQLAAYTLIYFISPHPLEWQMGSSVYRLILHLLPALFLIIVYQASKMAELS